MPKTEVYPDYVISLTDQRWGGYVREDTVNSTNPITKTCPDSFAIPTEGYGIRFVKVSRYSNGVERRTVLDSSVAIKAIKNKEKEYEDIIEEPYKIRYIFGCPNNDLEWQKKTGWEPSVDPHTDSLWIEDGVQTVSYSANPTKYRFLKELENNASLPFRRDHVRALYYEIQPKKEAELDITAELAVIEATKEWEKLSMRGKNGTFTIDEQKTSGYAELLGIRAASLPEKLKSILVFAKTNPIAFIEKVRAYKEEVITEITHAMQLELLKFEGSQAVFIASKKNLELGKLTDGQSKIERLAVLLQTEEFKPTRVDLKNQIEVAKERNLN